MVDGLGVRGYCLWFMVYGSWFWVEELWFIVHGFGFSVEGFGFGVREEEFRDWGIGCRVWDVRFRVGCRVQGSGS